MFLSSSGLLTNTLLAVLLPLSYFILDSVVRVRKASDTDEPLQAEPLKHTDGKDTTCQTQEKQ